MWLYLQRKTSYFTVPPKKFLHIAPEPAFEKKFRNLFGKDVYVTADLLGSNVDVQVDVCELQFPDKSFDLILCSHVLEHVANDKKAMKELRRVLTNDGIAIILVPISGNTSLEDASVTDPKERERVFGQRDHVRRYGSDFKNRLVEAGFTVENLTRNDLATALEIDKMGLKPGDSIFICRRD
ncbi:MAG: class I SAM-dependent methyltransferase [Bdellovibrionales bacterium]|nr:class I SAM-dependent methyltransferase [Bdellovibrionales bacterium]